MTRKEYIHLLSGQIHNERSLPKITDELISHIEEQKQEFIKNGMTEQEAEECAVLEMGDPIEAGTELNKAHKPKLVWWLTAFYVIFGIFYLVTNYYYVYCYYTYSAGH